MSGAVTAIAAAAPKLCALCGFPGEHKHPTPPKDAVPLRCVYTKSAAHTQVLDGGRLSDWPDTMFSTDGPSKSSVRDRGKVAIYLFRDSFGVWVRVTHVDADPRRAPGDIPWSNIASVERLHP